MLPVIQNLANQYPYPKITLCGNTFENVATLFAMGQHVPLEIGRGGSIHPLVWLRWENPVRTWVTLVEANQPKPSMNPEWPTASVIQDATQPITVVMVGGSMILNATASATGDTVDIPVLDLRPVGLNIYGNLSDGLQVGKIRFTGNRMRNVGVAFSTYVMDLEPGRFSVEGQSAGMTYKKSEDRREP
jgi:hypothetical protein